MQLVDGEWLHDKLQKPIRGKEITATPNNYPINYVVAYTAHAVEWHGTKVGGMVKVWRHLAAPHFILVEFSAYMLK